MVFLKKVLLFLLCLSSLALVVNFNEPPSSWSEASIFQILMLFIPLLFSLTFFMFIFLNSLTKSFAASLGLLVLIVLYSSDHLTFITAPTVLALTAVAVCLTPKTRLDPKMKNPEKPKERHPDRPKLLKKL